MQCRDIFVYWPCSHVHWDHLCFHWHGRTARLQDYTTEDDRACPHLCRDHSDRHEAPLLHQHPEKALRGCGFTFTRKQRGGEN